MATGSAALPSFDSSQLAMRIRSEGSDGSPVSGGGMGGGVPDVGGGVGCVDGGGDGGGVLPGGGGAVAPGEGGGTLMPVPGVGTVPETLIRTSYRAEVQECFTNAAKLWPSPALRPNLMQRLRTAGGCTA